MQNSMTAQALDSDVTESAGCRACERRRTTRRAWLVQDLTAGLVLAAMLVPVGIAYAVASGLPGIYGLYATIVPLLVYALFGPSRIFVLGPDSALAAVILGVIVPLSAGDPQRAIALAGAMAVVSGAVLILAGRRVSASSPSCSPSRSATAT